MGLFPGLIPPSSSLFSGRPRLPTLAPTELRVSDQNWELRKRRPEDDHGSGPAPGEPATGSAPA